MAAMVACNIKACEFMATASPDAQAVSQACGGKLSASGIAINPLKRGWLDGKTCVSH
jgi:hypothetical protein